jgi:hypothetical protein
MTGRNQKHPSAKGMRTLTSNIGSPQTGTSNWSPTWTANRVHRQLVHPPCDLDSEAIFESQRGDHNRTQHGKFGRGASLKQRSCKLSDHYTFLCMLQGVPVNCKLDVAHATAAAAGRCSVVPHLCTPTRQCEAVCSCTIARLATAGRLSPHHPPSPHPCAMSQCTGKTHIGKQRKHQPRPLRTTAAEYEKRRRGKDCNFTRTHRLTHWSVCRSFLTALA